MERNHVAPVTITTEQIEAAIRAVDYAELGDACTTVATAVLDNGFVVVGTHSFPRAKHFSAREGQRLALEDIHARVQALLTFRALDARIQRDPSSRTRGSDPLHPETFPESFGALVSEEGDVVDAEFNPDVTPVVDAMADWNARQDAETANATSETFRDKDGNTVAVVDDTYLADGQNDAGVSHEQP